ncbi:MAG: Trp family transcriptional regulator [Candidatus Brennerbacteria bacterium]
MVYLSAPPYAPLSMPRTTKKHIGRSLRKKIWNQFFSEIAGFKNHNSDESFLNKFLTEDERLVLEKRLAVRYFLNQGKSLRETSRAADVSRRTVIFVKRGLIKSTRKPRSYDTLPPPRTNKEHWIERRKRGKKQYYMGAKVA